MTAMPPTVTVIIPCHNQAHFLASAIRSAQDQGGVSLDVIVVDDGSADDTQMVARRCGAALVAQANRGVAAARNAGLQAASGEFVIFLDADDELLPDAASSGCELLRRMPFAAAVGRHCQMMAADGVPLHTVPPPPAFGTVYGELLHRNVIWTPGAVVFRRAAIIAAGGFPDGASPSADYAVYLRMARAGQLVLDRRDAVRYRQHAANMSGDPVLMLHATMSVLARERRSLPRGWRRAYASGREAWSAFYGERVVEQMRAEARARRRLRELARAARALVRYCPGTIATHARRKFGLVAGRMARTVGAARFSLSSGGTGDTRG